jgi:hypothetical protein
LWKHSLGWDAIAFKAEGAIASATVAAIMTAATIIICVFITQQEGTLHKRVIGYFLESFPIIRLYFGFFYFLESFPIIHRNSTETTFPYHALNVKTPIGTDLKKKDNGN